MTNEHAMEVVQQRGLAHLQKCTAGELRELLDQVNVEMYDLQEKLKQLKTQRQILEMLLYVMYPEEAKEETGLGYFHGAAHMIAIRLSQIRGERGAGKQRETCSVAGCQLDVMAKGFCKFHYDEETRDKRAAPLKEGAELHETAKKGHPKFVRKDLASPIPGTRSGCCDVEVYEGKKHEYGNRYCSKCWEPCQWKSTKPLATAWSCKIDGCKSLCPFAEGYCKKHYQEFGAKKNVPNTTWSQRIATPSENELLDDIRSDSDNDDGK
ncbi:MAG: hypothetical protein ACYC0X_04855 [Pirellulaceae bacterium]